MQLFLPAAKVRHQARISLRVENPIARKVQLLQHFDERHPIHAGGQIVKQLGGGGVAECAEFLHFPQLDGENVVENRLIDVGKNRFDQMLALPHAVGRGKDDLLAAFLGQPEAGDFIMALLAVHLDRAARLAAMKRRNILPPFRRKAVKHRTDELQKRRLAGLVRAVKDIQSVRESFDPQSAPNAVAVDF